MVTRRSAHSVEHVYVDAVRESVLRSPRKSICRLSAEPAFLGHLCIAP